MEQSITVVIPCLNEAGALPEVLAAMPAGYTALVVDNGSTDGTAQVARDHGAVVVAETQPGYGAAVHRGIESAADGIVCVLDGDGSLDPGELPVLVAAVRAGADLAVGRRQPVAGLAWPWHARLGNAIVTARLRSKHRLSVHDIAPMRASTRAALLGLNVRDRRFGYPLELLVRAAAANWRVDEIDVTYRSRTAGDSKVSGSVTGSYRAARDFWSVLS